MGPLSIPSNVDRALQASAILANPLAALVPATAALWLGRSAGGSLGWRVVFGLLAAIVAALGECAWIVLAVVGALAQGGAQPRWGFCWLLAVLLLLPGIYSPYLRLWLPTHAIVLVLAAGGLERAVRALALAAGSVRIAAVVAGTALLLAGWSGGYALRGRVRPDAWAGYRDVALRIVQGDRQLRGISEKRTSCLARPPFFYYAALGGLRMDRLSGDPNELQRPMDVVLIDGAMLSDNPRFAADVSRLESTWLSKLASIEYQPSLVTMLDDLAPRRLDRDDRRTRYVITVYTITVYESQ
jgi:hypothetical protein